MELFTNKRAEQLNGIIKKNISYLENLISNGNYNQCHPKLIHMGIDSSLKDMKKLFPVRMLLYNIGIIVFNKDLEIVASSYNDYIEIGGKFFRYWKSFAKKESFKDFMIRKVKT